MDFTFYIYAQKSDNTLLVEIRSGAKIYLQSRVVFKNIMYINMYKRKSTGGFLKTMWNV